ncbi:MAG: Gfo/Idh/MocA family oxidoreductase [Bacteroidetes bacterium]|nr:Gfo/Idh/MocA family oxidoreductase [Bacteroidota bacterium]
MRLGFKNFICLLTLFQTLCCTKSFAEEPPETLDVAIFGLGGRAHYLLAECVRLKQSTGKELRVVAICDNQPQTSYDFFIKNRLPAELLDEYTLLFQNTNFYPDSEEGIRTLLNQHPNLDRIWITSSNDRHALHLQEILEHSSCENIFIEKPLFKTLEEFSQFNRGLGPKNIQVGLTLRSAKITQLVAENLKAHASALGKLQKIRSWEHVNFGHGLSIIMMNWRRYISLSGGLLIEKSVHDLDLAYFFMETLGAHPQSVSISTEVDHRFYKKSNKELIVSRLLSDPEVRNNAAGWDKIPWQRKIPFLYDPQGQIDWNATLDLFFEEFPEDDDFSHSDIIPDTHIVHSKITTETGDLIDFDLEVKLNLFAPQTIRGSLLSFERGSVEVDLEGSKMIVQIKDTPPLEINLETRRIPHAGGDVFVAHGILGTLPPGALSAQFSDPSVQISSMVGLISEYQAQRGIKTPIEIKKIDQRWVMESP